jgi:hypothetical protein
MTVVLAVQSKNLDADFIYVFLHFPFQVSIKIILGVVFLLPTP